MTKESWEKIIVGLILIAINGIVTTFLLLIIASNCEAQTQVSAHVEQSELRTCLEQFCGQYDF